MKKKYFSLVAFLLFTSVQAQVKIAEPEFIGACSLLMTDSTYISLIKETGAIKEHKTKTGLFSKVASTVGAVGTSAGLATAVLGNSANTLSTGVKVMNAATAIDAAGGAVGVLGTASGMDIVFAGKSSSMRIKNGDIRIVIKAEDNSIDPTELYRIVALKSSKKERRVQWLAMNGSTLTVEAKEKGYIPFIAKKYGSSSYLITIQASNLCAGEYAIFNLNSPNVQAATFGIDP